MEDDEFNSKLSLVIRKPQEGKTYICTSLIYNDRSNDVHIVLTMNTLSSGMQFFGRMEEQIGHENIIVVNSNSSTAGECHYASNVASTIQLMIKCPKIKVIVCCAHKKRFDETLPLLIDILTGHELFSRNNRKLKIHIDEAHAYIPSYRKQIYMFNSSRIVKDIIGYTGTPNKVWAEKVLKSSDALFRKILIRDVDEELQIIRSPNYYGVVDCDVKIYETYIQCDVSTVDPKIPLITFARAGMTEKNIPDWLGPNYPFKLGDEMKLIWFIQTILPMLEIPQIGFTYHFIPGYTRKATHYHIMELVLAVFPNANVIVMNGNGIALFRKNRHTGKSHLVCSNRQEEFENIMEPSCVIEQLIHDCNDCPTFVTGLTCVGMSVTLINQRLKNFDNVVFAHDHFSPDELYQLCRFLFNYSGWSEENKLKIKPTKIHSYVTHVYETIIKYEENVEKMSTEWAGKICSLREIQGLEELQPSASEIERTELSAVKFLNTDNYWKRFAVYDGNDDEEWDKARQFYKSVVGKEINGKSMPKKIDGFYHCSTTGKVVKHSKIEIDSMKQQSWWSTFALNQRKFKYARVFVGYDNLDNSTEYFIYIKHAIIDETDEQSVRTIKKYGKKTSQLRLAND